MDVEFTLAAQYLSTVEQIQSGSAGFSARAAKNHAARVARDHQFFVRSHDSHDASAFRGADHVFGSVVFSRVDAYAEMAKIVADLLANGWRMFPDAAGEYEHIDAAQHGGKGADLLAN